MTPARKRSLTTRSASRAARTPSSAAATAARPEVISSERFRAGVITQIEVLDAQLALLQAQLDRTRALANVRLAEARLARAMGQ